MLKEKILQKRPVLKEIFEANRDISVREYANSLISQSSKPDSKRKQEFVSTVFAEAGRHFPASVAQSIAGEMQTHYCVSTAEHHGPLTHPFFVHSNLLTIGQGLKSTVILAVGNVSMNNSSYPRGLIFHSADGAEHRLPLFSAKNRVAPVFNHRPFGQGDLNRLQNNLKHKVSLSLFGPGLAKKVAELIERAYGSPEVLEKSKFSEQVSVSNSILWKSFFQASGVEVPNLAMLQLENIVLRLLVDFHIFSATEISDILFNPATFEAVKDNFDNIPGNFSIKEKKGTFLFWAWSKKTGRRERLWPAGGKLESEQGYCVRMQPEDLHAAIGRGELIPSTFLSLLLLSEYYGVKCLGGFTQGTYLTQLHRAYIKMSGASGIFPDNHTKGLRSDFIIGYFRSQTGRLVGASGIDLALHNNKESWNGFKQTMEKLTLEESMAPLFPELYRALYSGDSQQPELSKIGMDDIINYYRLADKITPCINIAL